MANSRNFRSLNNAAGIESRIASRFERALGEIRARVSLLAGDVSGPGLARAKPADECALGVAYSGGLDSTVLLLLAADYARRHGLRVQALHVHHGLSPNADAWAAHCGQTCHALGIDLHVSHVTVSVRKQSLEAAARQARYAALGQACESRNLPVLLTAHHQDDQAETVLLQLLRGAGVAGLSGMGSAERRADLFGHDIMLGRPLLDCRRSELEAVAAARGLQWITDESNADTRWRRNALRHAVLPVLEQAFAGSAASIARSAAHMQSTQTLLEDLARIDLERCGACKGAALQVDQLRKLSGERAANLLRYWMASQQARMPSSVQLQQVLQQMLSPRPDAQPLVAIDGIELRRSAGLLHMVAPSPPWQPADVSLDWKGEAAIIVPEWRGRLLFHRSSGPALSPEALRASSILLRARSGQERVLLAPGRPSRSLKNVYQEAGIPAWQRRMLPLAWQDGALLLVAGIGMDYRRLRPEPGVVLEWQADPARG
ncbi:MAG: mesJ1 [Paucimonas sp.]|nr:mesJ1 [Paucimonas sp.]